MKTIIKICPICSIEFNVLYCHRDRYITCGYKCGGIYKSKPRINNKCKFCNKDFISKKTPTKEQSFCSTNCARKSRKNGIYRNCKECGNAIYVPKHKINTNHRYFCSSVCRIKSWNRDSIKAQMPGSYRENAWKIYEKKCYDCGIMDERLLVIHHIDGNRKNGKLDNLIPVCHNCHCIRHIELSGNNRLPSYRGSD